MLRSNKQILLTLLFAAMAEKNNDLKWTDRLILMKACKIVDDIDPTEDEPLSQVDTIDNDT